MRRAWDYATVWIAMFYRLVWRLEDTQRGRYSMRRAAFIAHVNAQTCMSMRADRRAAEKASV